MRNILFFDAMLTPKIITLVYWLSLVVVVIFGIGSVIAGVAGAGFGKIVSGLLIMVGGAVGVRIYCEILIVLFKIHENLRKLAERQN